MSSYCTTATANKWSNTARFAKWPNHKHLKWTLLNPKSYSAMNQSKSCSLWTKCFIFLACMPFSNGCVDSAWRKTRSKSHGSSVKHVLFTQTDSQPAFTSQARPTLPRIQNKCTFQDFSLFNSGFPLPPTPPHPLFLCLSFLSLRFAARENKMFSENEIRNITFQVLSGLVFVHKHGKRLPSNTLSLCSVVFVLQ